MRFGKTLIILIYFISLFGVGCGGESSGGSGSNRGLTNGRSLPPLSGPNVIRATVSGDQCISVPANDASSVVNPNTLCASVVVCSPNATSASDSSCQTISGLLVDTGSVGLRVFRSVMNSSLLSSLTSISVGSKVAAECVTYADGSADWGPIARATVFLGGESGVTTQIQVIDDAYGGAWNGTSSGATASGPAICNTLAGSTSSQKVLDSTPSQLGFNGILGVGLQSEDCGSICTVSSAFGIYFSCAGTLDSATSCSSTAVGIAKSKQVQNLVKLLPQDNNGVVIMMPSVDSLGASWADGYLVLGIATQSNNTPGSDVKSFSLDSYYEMSGNLNGRTQGVFIDSGSTYLNFQAGSSTAGLTNCKNYRSSFSGFYCPTGNSNTEVNVTLQLTNATVQLPIGNPISLFQNNYWAYGNIAYGSILFGFSLDTVDLGLPFYFGRNIYHGFDGTASVLGSGPLWAF